MSDPVDDDRPLGDDEYREDPDAAPTVEGRIDQATVEMHKLLRAAMIATVLVGGLIGAVDLVRGGGFHNTVGFLVGSVVATINLRILAGGFFAIMRGRAMSVQSLLAFGASFLGLCMLAIFVVTAHREWTLGFALGLTTPAVAGMLYGRTLTRS